MRTLTSAVETALDAGHVAFVFLADLDFASGSPSGTVYFNSGATKITWNGNAYLGIGNISSVSEVQESAQLGVAGIEFGLSAINQALIAIALDPSEYKNRNATLRLAILNTETLQPLEDPVVVWKGLMDQMPLVLGAEAPIRLRCESRGADWERARVRRFTDDDQRTNNPGDEFFKYTGEMTDKDLPWGVPGAAW